MLRNPPGTSLKRTCPPEPCPGTAPEPSRNASFGSRPGTAPEPILIKTPYLKLLGKKRAGSGIFPMSSGLKGWGRAILDQVVGNCISSFSPSPPTHVGTGSHQTVRTGYKALRTQRHREKRHISQVIQPQEFCSSLSRLKSFFFKSSPKSCIPAYPCVYAPEPFDKLQNTGKLSLHGWFTKLSCSTVSTTSISSS